MSRGGADPARPVLASGPAWAAPCTPIKSGVAAAAPSARENAWIQTVDFAGAGRLRPVAPARASPTFIGEMLKPAMIPASCCFRRSPALPIASRRRFGGAIARTRKDLPIIDRIGCRRLVSIICAGFMMSIFAPDPMRRGKKRCEASAWHAMAMLTVVYGASSRTRRPASDVDPGNKENEEVVCRTGQPRDPSRRPARSQLVAQQPPCARHSQR